MNPYQSPPLSPIGIVPTPTNFSRRIGPLLIAFLFVVTSLTGILSIFIPSLRAMTMPRFGWIGLMLCMNPLIFLVSWLRSPNQNTLRAAAFMSFAIGTINAVPLVYPGTVSIVANEFTDRLHSSWFWSVLSLLGVSLYLGILSLLPTLAQRETIADESISGD